LPQNISRFVIKSDIRRQSIIDYIKRNPKTTKTKVIQYMSKKGSSLMTTHRILNDLHEKGIINIERPNSQLNYLIINDENEYSKIYNWLTEIDKIIDSMILPMQNLEIFDRYEPQHMERAWVEKLRDHFVTAYVSVYCMLEILLIYISQKVPSQKDSWSLYSKVVELKIKVNQQKPIFHVEGLGLYWKKRPLIIADLNGLKYIDEQYRKYSESQGIPIYELTSNLISRIDDFKIEFLCSEDKD